MKHTVKLTTTGRSSGQPREATLYAFDDGDDLVIVASRGGAAMDPQWAGNLRAEPRATLTIDKQVREVIAREVDDRDRDRLWELVSSQFAFYKAYQRKTTRVIPLFVLETATGE